MRNYKFYRNTVLFVIVPNILLYIAMLITKNKIIAGIWIVSCFIYFILFVVQPEKVFFIDKNGKLKMKL